MQIITPGAHALFLGDAGIGDGNAIQCEAPIKDFDVYYKEPLIVGFHVVDGDYNESFIPGFHVVGEED